MVIQTATSTVWHDQEPAGAEEAGDALGEPAERVRVVVRADAQAAARAGTGLRRRRITGGARRRQPSGSTWSSTSSTVTAPTSRPASIAHRDGEQVVGGQPLGHVAQRQLGADRRRARRRRSARGAVPGASRSRRWKPTAPRKRAGRRGGRRADHEHLRRQLGRHLVAADHGERFGHRRRGRQDHRLGGHEAAGGVLVVGQQPSQRRRLLGHHRRQQRGPLVLRAARRAGRRRRRAPSPRSRAAARSTSRLSMIADAPRRRAAPR